MRNLRDWYLQQPAGMAGYGALRRALVVFGFLALAVVLASCAPSAASPAQSAAPYGQPAQAPNAVAQAPEATTVQAAPTAVIVPAVAAAPVASAAMVKVGKNDTLGRFLVDDQGKTLYLFTKDTKDTSNCYEGCATAWPPLLTEGTPKGGDGVDAALLGTTTRKDGKLQVTYGGWPLYYFAKDQKAGDTTGQEVGDVWYVVSSKGAKMEAANLAVSKNDALGKFLTDDEGHTLYLYTQDTKGTSNCYDKCAVAWPPLYTAGAPKAGDGVDASLLGTTQRKDGTTQVTYNGWPLYYWVKDQKPGDTTGQGVGGVWFLITAKGEKMGVTAAAAPAQPASAAQTIMVDIRNFSFGAPLTIKIGTTVQWTNQDSAAHTVTADNGAFDSGSIDKGATFKFTFAQEGTFSYHCAYHSGMKGQVVVTK